jgi:hypothetical protein
VTGASESFSTSEVYCARHPQVETALRCGRCDTPICPRCLVQGPVGARCPDCANLRRLPTVDVSPVYLARGLAAGLAAGVAVGAAWAYITGGRGVFGFFIIFIAMGIGWAVAEAVSWATNRKRSTALAGCAICGVVVAYFVHNLVAGDPLLPRGDLWNYIAVVLAAVFASQRLKP